MNPIDPMRAVEPRWLVEERDACGVGFIANREGQGSHDILQKALSALSCLEHRGGCSADRDSGDGAGITAAVPWALLDRWARDRGRDLPLPDRTGVAMVFLSQVANEAKEARSLVEETIVRAGLQVIGWREVPVNPDVLGVQARENQPRIEQLVVTSDRLRGDALERELYWLRRQVGKHMDSNPRLHWGDNFYICSWSNRTIVYKAMVRSAVLGDLYLDLRDPTYETPFAVYHRRFSTNTLPKWPLAQPMRLLGHNGEINTLLGNVNWMEARAADLAHPHWGDRVEALKPVVSLHISDSANLDNVFELLVRSGRSPLEALAILVPEAYRNQPELANDPEVVDFYEYYTGVQEAWDGPALLAFSDGKVVGACLDRNGLRPARYVLMRDGMVFVSSETGVVDLPAGEIVEKGRLGPGEAIAVDLENKKVLKNWDIKRQIARKQPYGEWVATHRQVLPERKIPEAIAFSAEELVQQQASFGYTAEDVEMIVEAMAGLGKEPTFCMGNDTPLAVLSDKPRLLYDYFKQRFAQVTNPPIDPLREGLVMSLNMYLGPRGNLLDEKPEYARLLKLETPILSEADVESILASDFPTATLSTLFPTRAGREGMQRAIEELCAAAAAQVRAGKEILLLSDGKRVAASRPSLTEESAYIPPLLAVGAVHHHLIRQGLRMRTSIVVETGQCWSTHHVACLVGYGASAVCPYLTWDAVRHWWHAPKTQKQVETGKLGVRSLANALANYRKAMEAGLLKILSKMGISLLSSYQGAQIFEAIGIGPKTIEMAFFGTTSRIGGLEIVELGREVLALHQRGFPAAKKLQNFGLIQSRRGGEFHINSPDMSKALHKAVRDRQYDHYEVYREYMRGRPLTALRDLLDLEGDRASVPLAEVEPAEEIVKRFCTGGMSLGALSREAHETLAIAMNRIGGRSNSGEGGEDAIRLKVLDDVDENGLSPSFPHLKGLRNGDTASSGIKQVASGRFGVTPEYLAKAGQLEIKMAQGAKPGEGGQLPGKKVSSYIAVLRRSKPGVPLISPPPHHDIYSIEDLAQLIFDLHQINPRAKVSVKLVSSIGIGTVAAGVAKANADVIQISGHEGGTGASPLSSIQHAGSPWELGLTEVHAALVRNQLRDRVILRVDGGLRTGWDVVMAALMGAEQYGFGSIAMIAEGCIMARVCHTNTCPVGVATQQERLRKRFPGTPEHVVNFFHFVAEEVRSLLARLGYRNLNEIVGRSDLLKARDDAQLTKPPSVNLDCLTKLPQSENRDWLKHEDSHSNGPVLDDELLADPEIREAIARQGDVAKTLKIVNTDRAVGARVAGAIAKEYGNTGFAGHLHLHFQGHAGQSFGAFNLPGMTLVLEGDANDYVGKGANGGEIIIKPPAGSTFEASENAIVGNTCLYGSTGGILYACGRAGERFAVRNSQGQAVVEGTGDHCCEYMTGGTIVVLGTTGRNVGAGMTGGIAYFLDEDGRFPEKVNPEIVKIQRIASPVGERQLKELVRAHANRTGSTKARKILDRWAEYLPQFWQVVPPSEAEAPEVSAKQVEVPV